MLPDDVRECGDCGTLLWGSQDCHVCSGIAFTQEELKWIKDTARNNEFPKHDANSLLETLCLVYQRDKEELDYYKAVEKEESA